MNRIRKKFIDLKSAGKKALIPYITPEFPVRGSTLPVLKALSGAGADLIEVGIPFSDPLADGTTIQHSSEIALNNGASISLILSVVKEFRQTHETPLLLMGYVNPILSFGIPKFAEAARSAGVDGLIVPDLPPEEAGDLLAACRQQELSNVFLLAPTTPDSRIRIIDEHSTDFSYCVSVTGVTGARSSLGSNGSLDTFLARVRKNTKKPFVVGFGISTAAQVRNIWRSADGAVVGSALVSQLASATGPEEAANEAGKFLTSLR